MASPPSWKVCLKPLFLSRPSEAATLSSDAAISLGFVERLIASSPSEVYTVEVQVFCRGGHLASPFAFVTGCGAVDDSDLLAAGVLVEGVQCEVKRRKKGKREREATVSGEGGREAKSDQDQRDRKEKKKQQKKTGAANAAAANAASATVVPVSVSWNNSMYDRFASRSTTLDKNAQTSSLSPELLSLVVAYLVSRFPSSPSAVQALKLVWESEESPDALRVKELFETVETFVVLEKQISRIRSRAAKEARTFLPPESGAATPRSPAQGRGGIDRIYDLASGHGLLGVLLAHRFPACAVVCVDLERRKHFDLYLASFRSAAAACERSSPSLPLSNVSFEEADIKTVELPPASFVVIVHGCNEANVLAMDMARNAGAGFAAMPCCIRDGLYSVKVSGAGVLQMRQHETVKGMLAASLL